MINNLNQQSDAPLDLSKAVLNMHGMIQFAKAVAGLYDTLGEVGFDLGAAKTGVPKSS